MSQFVRQTMEDVLNNEDSLLMEFLEADKDPGNKEVRKDFSLIEGEDFIDLEEFNQNVKHTINLSLFFFSRIDKILASEGRMGKV